MLHPASRILIYLVVALAIPGLPFLLPVILLLAAIPLLLAWHRRAWALIWRTRWLFLVLFLGYAYSLPGAPLLPLLGDWSPSVEGARFGGLQALRLLTLLLWLDILVLRMPPAELLAGLYTLFKPLDRLGLDGARLALRLGLTLRAIEGLERGRGNLRALFDDTLVEDAPARELPRAIRIDLVAPRARDYLLPALVCAVLAALWFNA